MKKEQLLAWLEYFVAAPLLPLTPKGECAPFVAGVLPFRGVRGVSGGKQLWTFYISILLTILCLVVGITSAKAIQNGQPQPKSFQPLKFDFGSGEVKPGYIAVTASSIYKPGEKFGIVSEQPVSAENRTGKNKLTSDFITSDHPYYFNVRVPEGQYRITLTLGDSEGTSATTVKAESRRLMLENIQTKKGETVQKTIVVDVRTPKINATEEVHRKPRELKYLNWDKLLTLEIDGPHSCVSSVEIEQANELPTIFLAGNSTVVDQEYEPWCSWGQMFPRFLNPEIVVANYAESGETLLAFRHENRLKKLLSKMKPGDYLFIEFAHNDQKPGPNHVDPYTTYQDQLRYFINEARKRGGKPVLVPSTNRRFFDKNGKIVNTLEEYPDAMRQLAKEENVPLIDLNAMSKVFFEALGSENSTKAFVHYPAHTYPGQDKALADNTHFNPYGAYELAKCVVHSILEQHLDLSKYVVDDFKAFDPAHPDSWKGFFWPDSPSSSIIKPDGN